MSHLFNRDNVMLNQPFWRKHRVAAAIGTLALAGALQVQASTLRIADGGGYPVNAGSAGSGL
jgi:peptide/nickel transport system substrate-binding protein